MNVKINLWQNIPGDLYKLMDNAHVHILLYVILLYHILLYHWKKHAIL